MFLYQNPLGQALRRIVFQNRNARLRQDLAVIKFVINQMHRASGFRIAGFQHRFMNMMAVHAGPAIFGQERWVDI